MKKISLLLLICFMIPLSAYAYDDPFGDDPMDVIGARKPFGIEDRVFELGLLHFNGNFTNNFLSVSDVFSETIVIDLDQLADGFKFNLGVNFSPFHIKVDPKKGWGFGFGTSLEGVGILGLSGNMLSFSKAVDDKSDLSGAAFAAIDMTSFFSVQKFKVKIDPSFFWALAYLKPDISYTYDTSSGGTVLCLGYDVQVYTAVPMDGEFELTAKPGFDISVGVEYPLSKEIGLTSLFPFLDFDVGLDFVNIPVFSSRMEDYMRVRGQIGSKNAIDLDDIDGFLSSFDEDSEPVYGKKELRVYRPFKTLLWADWRPINGRKLLTIRPVFGFMVNDLYQDPVSLEIGINSHLNLVNLFHTRIGINYTDRMWINSLDFALNLRAFELNLGADLRSQSFAKSWAGAGFGFNFGLKFGW
ncbi:MAG: hypothetical protein FWD22_05475 [Treponema sp.]|nr:hypothetical protein [Treponema sp.]